MSKSLLSRLEVWCESNCDGHWEHQRRVQISSLDNPGWRVEINLEGTNLEGALDAEAKRNYWSDTDWCFCRIEKGTLFSGFGGITNLEEILAAFFRFVDSGQLEIDES